MKFYEAHTRKKEAGLNGEWIFYWAMIENKGLRADVNMCVWLTHLYAVIPCVWKTDEWKHKKRSVWKFFWIQLLEVFLFACRHENSWKRISWKYSMEKAECAHLRRSIDSKSFQWTMEAKTNIRMPLYDTEIFLHSHEPFRIPSELIEPLRVAVRVGFGCGCSDNNRTCTIFLIYFSSTQWVRNKKKNRG